MIILFFSLPLHARVFNAAEANFASYFKGTLGYSAVKKHGYDKTSGAETEFDDSVKYNWGGEFGFMFPSPNYAFRLGLEVISPSSPAGIEGNDTGGSGLYMNLDSTIYGFFPVGHFEYYVARNVLGKVFLSIGAGYGKVSLTNDYTLSAAGAAHYSLSSFKEKSSQYATLFETAVGYEMEFVQAVTLAFDFGYRYSIADDLKYENDGTNFLGAHSSGDPVLNSDGKHKTLDLGGVFAGLSFRFYFN